ncbi:MAG: hypothetical protein QG657_1670, partial [Acidobacteriota bacterium]|nr:hypothetical protein [Acidobacteriota bacterium]
MTRENGIYRKFQEIIKIWYTSICPSLTSIPGAIMQIINLIDWVLSILTTLFCALFLFSSIREKERRAAFITFICLAGNMGLWSFLILF